MIGGERYSIVPFRDYTTRTRKRTEYPSERIAALKDMAVDRGVNTVGPMLDTFFDNNVRNAFYHSNYTIHDSEFRYRRKGIGVVVPLEDVWRKIAAAAAFYQAFIVVYTDHLASYKEPKVIRGRLDPGRDITVLVQEGSGLIGLTSS